MTILEQSLKSPTSVSSSLEINGLGKRFGTQWVLSDIHIRVGPGESIALFGRNGSGKSTLLRIVASLLLPTVGSIRVLGLDPANEKGALRRRIRFLGHEKQLYDSLTVQESLRLAAGLRGVASATIRPLLEQLGIGGFGKARIDHLSEGMKKRVVLARLLLGIDEAELILLDEPHPALDQEGRVILNRLISDWRKGGKTIVMASHDHEQALCHADRLIVLEGAPTGGASSGGGRIAYDGVPKSDGIF